MKQALIFVWQGFIHVYWSLQLFFSCAFVMDIQNIKQTALDSNRWDPL